MTKGQNIDGEDRDKGSWTAAVRHGGGTGGRLGSLELGNSAGLWAQNERVTSFPEREKEEEGCVSLEEREGP